MRRLAVFTVRSYHGVAECAPMAATLDTQTSAASPIRSYRAMLIGLSAVFLAGALFVVLAAVPYLFSVSEAQFKVYWPRRYWLLAHISMGIVALLSGPVQLWLGFCCRPCRAAGSRASLRR